MGLQIKFFGLQLTSVFNFIEALGHEPCSVLNAVIL